jgi:hypothetical protein
VETSNLTCPVLFLFLILGFRRLTEYVSMALMTGLLFGRYPVYISTDVPIVA